MEQKRFLLAIILSAAVLFAWSYFFQRQQPKEKGKEQPVAQTAPSPSPSNQPSPVTPTAPAVSPNTVVSNAPRVSVTIESPLYEVKLDSLGAVATSWILKASKDPHDPKKIGKPLYSASNNGKDKQPLQLIPTQELDKSPAKPLALVSNDLAINNLLASNNFRVSGGSGDAQGDLTLNVQSGQPLEIDFLLNDPDRKIEVKKSFIFKPDSYIVDLKTQAARDGQPISDLKLAIGPNIGDQAVTHYGFYSIAPEATAETVDNSTLTFTGAAVHGNKNSPDFEKANGKISWAGIGDSYFAMAAIPSVSKEGLELRTAKYESSASKDERYLIAAFVPISSDGSPTHIYAGPKDHYLLDSASQEIGGGIDLERMINYGRLQIITRPLSRPILASINWLNRLTGNYGVAIIIFTIIIYSLFFPLKWRSSISMKKAQKLQPRMKEIQEKLKGLKQDDPRFKELQMEQLRLMREGNPLGGCLPLLIQFPFLFALYCAITVSIDFRQATFLWIPDLSAADPIRILPILMAASMVVLQLITPAPSADPLQKRMMAVVLPAFMLYILWSSPAGLLIYWLVGNIVGFSQQMLINRLVKDGEGGDQPPQVEVKPQPSRNMRTARAS